MEQSNIFTSTWFSSAQNSYYKVSGEFLRQDSQSSDSSGKIQNVGETELFEEKNVVFHWRKISYLVFILQSKFFLFVTYRSRDIKMHIHGNRVFVSKFNILLKAFSNLVIFKNC